MPATKHCFKHIIVGHLKASNYLFVHDPCFQMASVICRVVLDVIAVTGTDGALEPAVGPCVLNHLNTALIYPSLFQSHQDPLRP